MEMPSACLMVKTIKLSEIDQDWEIDSFLEDRQPVEIIWFKVISESAAMGIWLLLQFAGRRSFRGCFQETNLHSGGMWVNNVPCGIATRASAEV